MRRKISEVDELASELPEITHQQLEFVRHYISGMTATDAYKKSYDCTNMLATTIWSAASRLRHDSKVSVWIAAARKANLGACSVTLEQHIAELERLKEIALETGNVGAAVQAEQLRGKAQGHYTERVEVTQQDPLATLRQIAQVSPAMASELAKEQGLDWPTEH